MGQAFESASARRLNAAEQPQPQQQQGQRSSPHHSLNLACIDRQGWFHGLLWVTQSLIRHDKDEGSKQLFTTESDQRHKNAGNQEGVSSGQALFDCKWDLELPSTKQSNSQPQQWTPVTRWTASPRRRTDPRCKPHKARIAHSGHWRMVTLSALVAT